MKIIHTTATPEQQKMDRKDLIEANKKASKSSPTWDFFGGVLTVNGRKYQVIGK
jgi:hypothetical protein